MSAVYFPRVIRDSGQAGVEPTTLEATEGAAGNISAFVRALRNLDEGFVPRDELCAGYMRRPPNPPADDACSQHSRASSSPSRSVPAPTAHLPPLIASKENDIFIYP